MTALTVATFPSREGLTIPERPLKLLQVVLLISDRFVKDWDRSLVDF